MASFRRDLIIGEKAEEKVRELISSSGIKAVKSEERATDITYILDNRIFYAEVKNDILAYKTGNMAIEYSNSKTGLPTGILLTESDIWFVVLGDVWKGCEIWVANTKALKNYFHNTKSVKDVEGAGDGNATIRLFRLDKILDSVFNRLDELSPEEVKKTLETVSRARNEQK